MILAIDIGNTRTKLALADNGRIVEKWVFPSRNFEKELSEIMSQLDRHIQLRVGWISTAMRINPEDLDTWRLLDHKPEFFFNSESELPIGNKYSTPATLGTDRIVAVIAAREIAVSRPVLVIDTGTAITYDFADQEGDYLGGGISPGLHMRFKALNAFTARLPLIEDYSSAHLIGDSTANSLRSGVLNGAIAEIEGIIARYKEKFGEEVQVFLTGGNTRFFENQVKSFNFVDPDLVLKGIAVIVNWMANRRRGKTKEHKR